MNRPVQRRPEISLAISLALGAGFVFPSYASAESPVPNPPEWSNPVSPSLQSESSVFTSSLTSASLNSTGSQAAGDPSLPLDGILTYLPLISRLVPPQLGDLSSGWYLMVDDGHIVSRDLERIYYPFQKYSGNPVLRADRSWEGKVVQLYGAVLPGFRMWYSSYNQDANQGQVLYASSSDGLTWIKPSLSASGRNALFGEANANLVSVLHTPHDFSSPFKLMAYQNGAFNGYASPDGISTTPFAGNPLYSSGSDIAHFYWDSLLGSYRGTSKTSQSILGVTRRVIRFIDSPDLVDWLPQPDLLVPDINDDQIFSGYFTNFYGLPVFPSGEQYLGLLWVLKARDQAGLHGKTTIQLVSSHDGAHWIREEGNRPSILEVGPPSAWDDGQVYTASSPVKVGDEFWLYYSGCNQEHGASLQNTTCSIGLAKAGFNRLASLTGSGSLLTEILEPAGSQLHLNLDASKGQIRVELLVDGVPLPGYEAEHCLPLTQNSYDQLVAWAQHDTLPGNPFQIKFVLEDSSLFAFEISGK